MSRAGEGRAGAELDRMVAEKAMGWKLLDPSRSKRHQSHFIDEHGRPVSHWSNVGNHCDIYDEVYFYPSSNIAHAWEVVEKLRLMVFPCKAGWAAAKVRYDKAGEGPAHDDGWIDDSLDFYATADTAPLAICLAALRAVGEGE